MTQGTGLGRWRDRRADTIDEPWFRFGRVCALLDRYASVPVGSRWLDLGCQIGQFLGFLMVRYGISPVGIDDFDEGNVEAVCKTHFSLAIREPKEIFDGSWQYHPRRIDKVGFAVDERFPFMSALEIIEHMVDTDAFLQECRAHLADGAFLIVSTPNINSLRNRVQVLFGRYPAGPEHRTVVHHVRVYNADKLRQQCSEHGLRCVGMAGVNFLPVRFLRFRMMRRVDAWLADRFPTFCGNLIAVFVAETLPP